MRSTCASILSKLEKCKVNFFQVKSTNSKWCPLGRAMVDKGETLANIRDSCMNPRWRLEFPVDSMANKLKHAQLITVPL